MDWNVLILLQHQNQLTKVLETNRRTEAFGLILSEADAELILAERGRALKEQRRVEFGAGIAEKLIYEFCDSDFIDQSNYVETILRLQEIFYQYKNEMQDELTDDELLHLMKEQFENLCLRDTFLAGLPEFFQRYDARFAPMDTLLTLDYPILMDLSRYCGVDRIYPYLTCIQLEQKFLHQFLKDDVLQILCQYHRNYREIIENLTEIVLSSALEHLLAGKPLSEPKLSEADNARIRKNLCQSENADIRDKLREAVQKLVDVYYEGDQALRDYLWLAADNIAVRMSIHYR